MRNLKKILALVLALMMTLSLMVTASASNFKDVADGSDYEVAIDVMSGIGVLNGTGAGNFNPDGTLKRDQAAKIIAYMMLGKGAEELPRDASVFSDVGNYWGNGPIAYCAAEGIVDGNGNGTFSPNGTLTGYQFGKMLLNAIGIEGKYTGKNWQMNVATALTKNKITAGVTSLTLSKPLTRAQAAQMAFNALIYTPAGSTSAYEVKDGSGNLLYRGTDALTALIMKQANASNTLALVTSYAGSLAASVHDLTKSSTTDDFGRTATTWEDVNDSTVVYSSTAAKPLKSYTTATTYGKIAADLGYTTVGANLTMNPIINGKADTAVTAVDRTKTTAGDAVGGTGTLVEVYQVDVKEFNVVVIETNAHVLAAGDIHAATAATASADAVPAYITIESQNYETNDFKAGDVVLYTKVGTSASDKTATKIVNVAKADYVSGHVTATASDYFRLDGTVKYVSENAADLDSSATVFADPTSLTVSTSNAFTFFFDNYGNVIAMKAGETANPDTNYAYVIDVASKAAVPGAGSDLFTPTAGSAAIAQAKIIDVKTGEIKVVNLGVAQKPDGKYYYANQLGAAGSTEVDGINDPDNWTAAGIYKYVELTNGAYVLVAAKETGVSVDVQKNVATLGASASGKYVTSNTKLTVVEYTTNTNGDITAATVSNTVGLANFPSSKTTYAGAVVTADTNGIVSDILVVQSKTTISAQPYAVYAGEGETDTTGTKHAFYVKGELVQYYVTTGSMSSFSAGDVVQYTLTNGAIADASTDVTKLTGVAASELATGAQITYVDPNGSYFIAGGTVYYLASGYETYSVSAKYAATTLAVNQTVSVYGSTNATSGANTANYILVTG